jgi:hypothetical protein
MWLGPWAGEYLGQKATWLRLYDKAGNLVPIKAEAVEAELVQLKAWLAQKGLSPDSPP